MSRKAASSYRATLLLLLLVMLAVSFVVLTPQPATAYLICSGPSPSYQGTWTTYYTDATYSTIACEESCGDTSCDPTPYVKRHPCCCWM
jgi:hypothetical protein